MRDGARANLVGKALLLLAAVLPVEASAEAAPATTPQSAEAYETARKLSTDAVKLYDLGKFELALDLFEKADALYAAPSYRVYVARAYAKLGKLRRSIAKYDEAIQMARPPGAPPSFLEAQQTAAEERAETVKRVPSLRIEVTGAPAEDVTLTVDGEPVTAPDWPHVELDPGRHQIAATSPPNLAGSQSVELGESMSTTVQLALLPPAAPSPPFRPLAITAGALGGAGLIVAVVSGAVLAGKHSAIEQECPNQLCSPAGRALINSVPPINAVNLGGWIAAAAGGTAAAVLLALHIRGSKPATAIAPAPLAAGGGLWISGTF